MSDDSKIELNRRRVLGGIVTVGAAAAAAGAGTFALFSDTEESANNSITAGTLDLQNTATGVIDVNNAYPGDSITDSSAGGPYQITTEYSANVDANISVSFTISDADAGSEPTVTPNGNSVSASEFAQQLNVDTAEINSYDLTQGMENPTLDDLVTNSEFTDVVTASSGGETITLSLAFTFDSDAGNEYQADGVSVEVSFNATQQSN